MLTFVSFFLFKEPSLAPSNVESVHNSLAKSRAQLQSDIRHLREGLASLPSTEEPSSSGAQESNELRMGAIQEVISVR